MSSTLGVFMFLCGLLWGICGGFVTLGVDKNAKCWYIASKDNKVSGHLNDHKYQVLFSIKHPIDSH